MTPKQYLSKIKYIDDLIDTKLSSINSLRDNLFNITSKVQADKVQSNNQSDFTDTVNKIVDLEAETEIYIDELVNLKSLVEAEINALDNNLHKVILINCYVLNKTLRDIADEYAYSYSHVKREHGEALQAFRRKYPEKFKR